MSDQDKNIDLSKIAKDGELSVKLEGDHFMAPFSRDPCVWFEWIHDIDGMQLENGYTVGGETNEDVAIKLATSEGNVNVYLDRVMLYLAPSFDGRVVVDEKERHVQEYCLRPDRTYHLFFEKRVSRLPPYRFFPFLARSRSDWMPALSDTPLERGSPVHPLIPTRRGWCG